MYTKILFRNMLNLLFMTLVIISGMSGCNLLDPDNEEDSNSDDLYVQFNNSSSSTYTITCIELQAIGRADETPVLSGTWSSNKLENIGEIAPGGQQYFHAEIPRQHRCYYRLGIKNADGTTLILNEQTHYVSDTYPTLTHWGADERTVTVTIAEDPQSGLIFLNGWSEWAGIE